MLSRSSQRLCLQTIQQSKRGFFDYLRVANQVDAGKTIQQIEQDMNAEDDKEQGGNFGWQWLSWFEKNAPEKYAEYSSARSQFQRWEQYLGERGVVSSKKVDFAEYRNKIADPTFVDELEIAFHTERSTVSSISNMATLDAWPSSAVSSFKAQCEEKGDQLVKPLSSEDRAAQAETLANAELYDEKTKLMAAEIQKDFEQMDAERMMLGQETLMMELSEHPQYAETLEDVYTAKQTYLDYVMMPIHNDYVKRERLVTMQDEERRKAFLERFERASKITNGVDCTVPQ